MKSKILTVCLLCTFLSGPLSAQNILEDDGIGMTSQELEQVVASWPLPMQQAAANDTADRLELLSKALISKKIEAEAAKLTPQENSELYWHRVMAVRKVVERMMIDDYAAQLEIPDMTGLAEERYIAEKDRYARVPEQRLTSHLLIACSNAACDNEEKKALAESLHARMLAGESLGDLVLEFSDDTASKSKRGRFDRWLTRSDKDVSTVYIRAAFELGKPGDFSGVVRSPFGYHIIALDESKPPYYKTYEEVEAKIIKDLQQQFKAQSVRSYVRSFKLSEQAKIDGPAMEEVFSKYKTATP